MVSHHKMCGKPVRAAVDAAYMNQNALILLTDCGHEIAAYACCAHCLFGIYSIRIAVLCDKLRSSKTRFRSCCSLL